MYKIKFLIIICIISIKAYGARFESTCIKDNIDNLSGNVHIMINKYDDILEIGKEFDELVHSKQGIESKFYATFNIKDINNIGQFTLMNVNYKDHILIKINDNFVWSSNGNSLLKLNTNKVINEKINHKHLEEEFNFFAVENASVETWMWHNKNISLDVQKYIKAGSNRVDITLISGLNGGFKAIFSAKQKPNKDIKCQDGHKVCSSTGERIIDGVRISRNWQYSYEKVCDYPSKNDCNQYMDCVLIADRECLLRDRYHNCVNVKREMSCEKLSTDTFNVDNVYFDLRDKNAATRLICSGIPCIDGTCVNQDSDKNAEMMTVMSKLHAVSQVKGSSVTAQVFKGSTKYCNDLRLLGYHDCCRMNGWGKYLGSRCGEAEEQLVKLRKENKCVYVGKKTNKVLGIKTSTINSYCCFNTVLDKLVQVQGRKQLGKNFGTAEYPNCEGLSIGEVLSLDFDKMDFSEFYADILKKMKLPKVDDMDKRMQNSLPNVQTFDQSSSDQENKKAGTNKDQINHLKNSEY